MTVVFHRTCSLNHATYNFSTTKLKLKGMVFNTVFNIQENSQRCIHNDIMKDVFQTFFQWLQNHHDQCINSQLWRTCSKEFDPLQESLLINTFSWPLVTLSYDIYLISIQLFTVIFPIWHILSKINGEAYFIDSKGFWRWCITHRITGFLDFSHHLVF
jgi:hypothetical protein